MLKITRLDNHEDAIVLKLEGRLVDQWVPLLEETCRTYEQAGATTLVLDLAGVGYASRTGIALLKRLRRTGARCVDWSPFLKEFFSNTTS